MSVRGQTSPYPCFGEVHTFCRHPWLQCYCSVSHYFLDWSWTDFKLTWLLLCLSEELVMAFGFSCTVINSCPLNCILPKLVFQWLSGLLQRGVWWKSSHWLTDFWSWGGKGHITVIIHIKTCFCFCFSTGASHGTSLLVWGVLSSERRVQNRTKEF